MAKPYANKTQRCALLASAIFLSLSAATAQADVFAGNPLSSAVHTLKGQVSSLEGQLAQVASQQQEILMKLDEQVSKTADAANANAAFKPSRLPTSSRIAELDILAEPPYVILGKVNGMTLVRVGDQRLLLDDERLARFEELEYKKAVLKKADPSLGGSPDLNLPPPPPPVTASAATKADAKQLKAVESSSAKQGGAKAARTAATTGPKK